MILTYFAYKRIRQFARTADMPSRQRLRSSTTDSLFLPSDFLLLDVVPFLSLVHVYRERFTFTRYLLAVSADI